MHTLYIREEQQAMHAMLLSLHTLNSIIMYCDIEECRMCKNKNIELCNVCPIKRRIII